MIKRNDPAFSWMQQHWLQEDDPWKLTVDQREWLAQLKKQLDWREEELTRELEWICAVLGESQEGRKKGYGKDDVG